MNTIYIDVQAYYKYDWKHAKDCCEVLRIQEGINGTVKFVCNSGGGFSRGDVYELAFDTPEDVTLYLVKNKFELIEVDKVDRYKLTH